MTTIAYRDRVMAADTQMTSGSCKTGHCVKVAKLGDWLFGYSGDPGLGRAAIRRWLDEGPLPEIPPPPNEVGSYLMAVDPQECVYIWDGDGWFERNGVYAALGSGSPVALGAMFMGADAKDAVRAAMAHDIYTGGDVLIVTL